MKSVVASALAGLALMAAMPQTAAAPPPYTTTNETAIFDQNTVLPGPYKGLYYNMSLWTYSQYHFGFATVGVYPPYQYQPAGIFHGTNGSYGSLSTSYPGSKVDHFQMFSFLAGCNGEAYYAAPAPSTQASNVPYPVNCTITAKGYSKQNPFTPIAQTTFTYRPVLQQSVFYPNGTAAMQSFTFPGTFQFLDRLVFTAKLLNTPPGVNFTSSYGVDVLVDDLVYSISNSTRATA